MKHSAFWTINKLLTICFCKAFRNLLLLENGSQKSTRLQKYSALFHNAFDFNAYLETLSEKRDGVQDCQTHFSGNIALQ